MSWVPVLIVLVPALAALVGFSAQRHWGMSRATAVGAAAIVTVLGGIEAAAPARSATIATVGPLRAGELDVPLHLLSDRLSGVVALTVGLVVLAIQAYSTWYLRDDRRRGVFLCSVSLFSSGMLLVVHAGDLLVMLVGWEVMGWCSWLLIGHYTARASARRAAFKAFLVTRTADIGMVVGLIALSARAGSTDLMAVLQAPGAHGLLTVGLVGVAIGVAGKSGLVPFHDWLPDAMEGPTPASALIHAATMVAAGTYVIARLFSLYGAHDGARTFLAVLAAVTMVWTAAVAFLQDDLKRLLAYSTLSQVAIMLGALAAVPAAHGPSAGIGHLIGHAYFKALLFLAAGWLAALVGGTALRLMHGRLRGRGLLRWSTVIGLLALAGLPPVIGFFTKDTAIAAAIDGTNEPVDALRGWLVVVAMLVTVGLTAAYCTRVWVLLDTPARTTGKTSGQTTGHAQAHTTAHGHHAPFTVVAGLSVLVLTTLTVAGTPMLGLLRGGLHLDPVIAVVSVAIVVATAWFVRRHALGASADAADSLVPQRIRRAGQSGFGADRVLAGFGNGVLRLARVTATLERDVVDGYPRATAVLARVAGVRADTAHRGRPANALVGVATGVAVLALVVAVGWLTWS